MKKHVLFGLFIGLSSIIYGQSDLCSDAITSGSIPIGGIVLNVPTSTDDASFDPVAADCLIPGSHVDAYILLNSATGGTYNILLSGGTMSGNACFAISPGISCAGFTEIGAGDIGTGFVEANCVSLPSGDFILAIAFEDGNEGSINATFSAVTLTNDDCANAGTAPLSAGGGSIYFNTCATVEPGEVAGDCYSSDFTQSATVWHSYTAANNYATVEFSFNPGSVGDPIQNQTITAFDGCTGTQWMNPAGSPNVTCDQSIIVVECVSAGDVINIQVASPLEDAGEYQMDVSESAILDIVHDACGSAKTLDNLGLTGETNSCSTFDLSPSCDGSTDLSTVWYNYTVPADVREITFSVVGTGSPAISSPVLAAYDGACGTTLYAVGSEDCGSGSLTVSCPTEGDVIALLVGSSPANQGGFDISVIETASENFDECTSPEDEGTLLECEIQNLDGTTVNACPEGITAGSCNLTVNPTVWHSVTLPTDADELEFSNITGGVSLSVWSNCNSALTPTCFSADQLVTGFTGGNTYLISVTSTLGAESAYSFDVLAVTPPGNDLCGNAAPLDNTGLLGETNSCATFDLSPTCDGSADLSSVWYNYTVPANVREITFTVSGGASPITSPVLAAYDGACGTMLYNTTSQDCGSGSLTISCPVEGEVIALLVGSSPINEGDFDISVTEIASENFDLCTAPEVEGTLLECEIQNFDGTTINACPEVANVGTCDLTNDPTVWHSVTLPANANGLEFTNITGGVSLTLWSDCTTEISPTCFIGDEEFMGLTGGNTYFISASSVTGTEGSYSFDLLAVTPPDNDMCNAAATLDNTGLLGESNACATFDLSPPCDGSADLSSVWYNYTVPANVREITFTVSGGASPITSPVLAAYDGACGTMLYNTTSQDCGSGSLTISCPVEGEVIALLVGSSPMNEGDFDISVTEIASENFDLCTAPEIEGTLLECEIQNFDGTTVNACPEIANVGTCDLTNDPTVWHSVMLPADADGLEFSNLTGGVSISLWSDCTTEISPTCFTGDEEFMGLTGGNTYFISVSSVTGSEGAYSFDLLAVTPPNNDLCNAAATLDNTGLTGETNSCATFDIAPACDGSTDLSSVWYNYTVPANVREITITVTGTGTPAITSPVIAAYVGACGTTLYDTSSEDCGSGSLTVSCPVEGDVIAILVGSSPMNEGGFDISITEETSVTNDECVNAEEILIATDCVFQTVNGDNTNACPENFTGPTCPINTDPTVWFEVALPANGTGLGFENLSANLQLIVWNDCPSNGGMFSPPDCFTGNQDFVLAGGNTYFISASLVGGAEGAFTFDIKTITAPDNDLCGDAEPLDNTGLLGQTNACASFDLAPPCDGSTDLSSVWYNYTVPANVREITITVTGTGTPAITSPVIAAYGGACGTTLYDTSSEDCGSGSLTVSCPVEGDVIAILVGSSPMNEGGFDISITEETSVTNDECVNAEEILIATDCVFQTVNGDNTNACPENFTGPTCPINTDPTVWFEVALPANGTGLGFENLSANLQLIVWNDCPSNGGMFLPPDCFTGNQDFVLAGGNTYLISASLVGGAEGAFTFDIKTITAPDNDLCGDAEPLDNTGLLGQTNACASFDLAPACDGSTDLSSVWYNYTVPANVREITITVTGTGTPAITSPVIAAYGGACGTTLYDTSSEDCGSGSLSISCPVEGDVIAILVGSSPMNEGGFDISITEEASVANDICANAEEITIVADCIFQTVNGDNTNACPETFTGPACPIDSDATVWFEITLPADATGLAFENLSANLQLTVWNGCPDMGGAFLNPPDCFTGNENLTGLSGGNTYYISAGLLIGTEGAFTFDIKTLTPPANDLCADAIVIDNVGLIGQTNNCASFDLSPPCDASTDLSTVWYNYTVPADVREITITLTPAAMNGIVDPVIAAYNGACGTTLYDTSSEDCGSGTLTISCPREGDVIAILVGSSTVNEGDFDISISEETSIANDECENAEEIVIVADCVFQTVNGDNTNACPEIFTGPSCPIDTDATVWFEVTLSAAATGLGFETLSPNLQLVVWDGCPDMSGGFLDPPNCFSGDEDILGLTGGNTYYISASLVGGAEGVFSFDIKTITPPVNDECADAIDMNLNGLSITGETNECSTSDVNPTCTTDMNTVWYEYTVQPGVKEITISVAPTTMLGNPNVAALLGCGTTLYDATSESCDGSDIVILCPVEGDVIAILVGSSEANEGMFDITITEEVDNAGCTDNDECADVDGAAVGSPITDGGQLCATDCNLLACPENFFAGACAFDQESVVWYSVTTDGNAMDATMNVIITSTNGDFNPIFAILQDNCAAPTSVAPDSDCVVGDGTSANYLGLEVDANTTYYIAVANESGDGGDFEICVEVVTICNDDPCGPAPAIELNANTCSFDIDCMTNEGSTADQIYTDCPPGTYDNSVYFQYQVGPDVDQIIIRYNAITIGPANISVWQYDLTDCMFNLGAPIVFECQTSNALLDPIDCLVEGDFYLIQVSTADGEQGTFDLTITKRENSDPCASNDDCEDAELTVPGVCTYVSYGGCTDNTCPESDDYNFAGCPWLSSGVVWHEIPTSPNASSLDINVLPGSMTDPVWALFSLPDCDSPPTVVAGTAACQDGELNNITITGGDTYFLAIASDSGNNGEYQLQILENISPEGDDPCATDDANPLDDVVDLGTGGSHSNTTCCAIGFNDDNSADWPNQQCTPGSDDNAVWYLFQPDLNADGFFVDVVGGTAGNLNVEVYSGQADAGCTGVLNLESSYCANGITTHLEVPLCAGIDPFIWIKVSSEDNVNVNNCGTFTIDVQNDTGCTNADICEESNININTVTDPDGAFNFFCEIGCMQYACPETIFTDCGFGNIPVVWIEVTPDDEAAILYANVTTDGNWQPVFAIYEGECPVQSILGFNSGPCNTQWNDPSQINQPVASSVDSYWIAVGANGTPEDIAANPDFEICVATTVNLIICLGDGSCTPETDWEVTDRDNDDLPLGDPTVDDIPFCPGETVEICAEFNYDASETGADWLIGVVPTFGPGWDLTSFDPNAATVTGNGMTAGWYPEGQAILQETVGSICTYPDPITGDLQICNVLCSACPCVPGMGEEDVLPGGWFWVTNGSGADCENDGTPGEGWGIGTSNVDITFCVELTVRDDFVDEADCNDPENLKFGFMPFSDGVAGCWNDQVGECRLDEPQSFNFDIACEVAPEVIVDGAPCADLECFHEICSDEVVGSFISVIDGSPTLIEIEFDANGTNVSGGGNHTFPGGFGNITDVLNNPETFPQTIIYEMQSVDPLKPCPSPPTLLYVTVLPAIQDDAGPFEMCEGGDNPTIEISPEGGTGNYVNYLWSDPAAGNTTTWIPTDVFVSAGSPYSYTVTVEDDGGCTGEIMVDLIVNPAILFDFDIVSNQYCLIDDFGANCDVSISADLVGGNYDYTWTTTPDFGIDFVGNQEEFILNICSSLPGSYTVNLAIEDENGCVGENSFDLDLGTEPTGQIALIGDVPCDDGSGTQQYDLFFQGDDVYLIEVVGPNGNVVGGATSDQLVLTVIGAGTYTFNLTESLVGCVNSIDFTITPPEATEIQISGDSPICGSESATIQVDNSFDFGAFVWSTNAPGGPPSITVSPAMTTTYSVTATDFLQCTSVATFEVEVGDEVVAQISGSLSYCPGTSTSLTGSGGDSYSWTLPDNTTSTDNPLDASMEGTYILTATDAAGCTGTAEVMVDESATLTPQINGADICDNGTVTLDAGMFDSYMWDGPEMSGAVSQTIDVGTPGVYTLTVTSGGCMGTGQITVEQYFTPVISDVEVSICNSDATGASTVIDLSTLFTEPGDFFDQSGVALADLVIDFDGSPVQTINYTYVTNSAQDPPCSNVEVNVVINVELCDCPLVDVNEPPVLCGNNPPFDLTTLELGTIADGSWFNLDGTPVSDEMVDLANGGGSYIFTLDVPGAPACDPSDTVELVVNMEPSIMVDPPSTTVCNDATSGGETMIDLNDYVTGDPGEWTDENGTVITAPINFQDSIVGNNYTYTFTTTNAIAPCENVSETLLIVVVNCDCPPLEILSPNPICNDAEGFNLSTLEVNVADGDWSVENGPQAVSLAGGTFFDPTGIAGGIYELCYTLDPAPGGACLAQDCVDLEVVESVSVTLTSNEINVCNSNALGDDTTVELDDYLPAGVSGVWTDAAGNILLGSATLIDFEGGSPNSFSTYTFTTDFAIAPCTDDSDQIQINIIDCTCPFVDTDPAGPFCNDSGQLDLTTILDSSSEPGTWVLSMGNPETLTLMNGSELDFTGVTAGDYEVCYVLSTVPPATCPTESCEIITINNAPFATITTTANVCNEAGGSGDTFIDFNSLVTGGDTSGSWDDSDNSGVDLNDLANVSFIGVDQNNSPYTFTYTTSSAMSPCVDQSYEVEIFVTNCLCPDPQLLPQELCITEGSYDLEMTITNTTVLGTWSDGNNDPISSVIDLTSFGAGSYTYFFNVTNAPMGSICNPFPVNINIAEPATAVLDLGPHSFCNFDDPINPFPNEVDFADFILSGDTNGTWSDDDNSMLNPNNGVVSFVDVAFGFYDFTYTVTSDTPCEDNSYTITIEVVDCNVPPCPDPELQPQLLCSTEGTYDLDLTISNTTVTGTWEDSNNLPISSMIDVSGLSAGNYTYFFNVTNAPAGAICTPYPVEIEISEPAVVQLELGPHNYCNFVDSGNPFPNEVDFADFILSGDTNGTWSDDDNTMLDPNAGVVSFVGVALGSYNFTYTVESDIPCENISEILTINVVDCTLPPCPDPELQSQVLCSVDGTYDLDMTILNTAVEGTWSDANNVTISSIIDLSVLAAGNYTYFFNVTNAPAGAICTPYPVAIEISIPSTAVLDLGPHSFCNFIDPANPYPNEVNFASFILSGDSNGTWADDDNTMLEPNNGLVSFVNVPFGTYNFTYTVVSDVPCPENSYVITIVVEDCNIPPCPDPDLQNPAVVCSTDGSVDLNTTIGDVAVTGFWADENFNPISNVVDITSFGTGLFNYNYVLDPAPMMGCDASFPLSLDIVAPNFPGVADMPLRICEDDVELVQLPTLLLDDPSPDAGGVWLSDPANVFAGDPFDSNGATFDPNGQAPGTYLFNYGWSNNPPCPDVATTVTIIIDPNPTADAGNGGVLNCSNSETGVVLDGTNSSGFNISYLWKEVTNNVNILDPTNPVITVTEPGDYVLDITDGNGCIDSDMASVTSDPDLPIMSVGSTSPICVGDAPGTITISGVTGGTEPYSYSIDNGATWVSDLVFSNLPAGNYEVWLEDANECRFTATATITEAGDPNVQTIENVNISLGDSLDIGSVTLNFDSAEVSNMVWTADGEEIYNGPYTENLMVTPQANVTEYCVLITDQSGCTTFDCVEVRAQQIVNVYFANVISTNSENGNDKFFAQSPDIVSVNKFYIFDRWGEKIYGIEGVFDPSDPDQNDIVSWDGLFKGERVAQGVYVYMVELLLEGESEPELFKGTLTVLY